MMLGESRLSLASRTTMQMLCCPSALLVKVLTSASSMLIMQVIWAGSDKCVACRLQVFDEAHKAKNLINSKGGP